MNGRRRLPDALVVTCFADAKPFPGAWVQVTLETSYKNPFILWYGPVDESGRIRISRQELLDEAHREREVALTDYGDPEDDWTGRISVRPVDSTDVRQALDAYEQWKNVAEYGSAYAEGLRQFADSLEGRTRELLRVEVAVQPAAAAEAAAVIAALSWDRLDHRGQGLYFAVVGGLLVLMQVHSSRWESSCSSRDGDDPPRSSTSNRPSYSPNRSLIRRIASSGVHGTNGCQSASKDTHHEDNAAMARDGRCRLLIHNYKEARDDDGLLF